MTQRAQINRSSVTNFFPPTNTRPPGELFANFPDRRLMVIDQAQTAQDFVGVRPFSSLANYPIGTVTTQAGDLWRAKAAITPHAFNATEWDLYQPQSASDLRYLTKAQADVLYTTQTQNDARYVQLAGSTMTGLLTLSGSPTSALHAATKGYVDARDALYLPLTGGNLSGQINLPYPTLSSHAATVQYVNDRDSLYLPLGGGTITGGLNVNGQFAAWAPDTYIAGALHINPANSWEWVFSVSGGNQVISHRSGWYEFWNGSDGSWSWNGPSYGLMYLSGGGDLSVHGNVFGNSVSTNNLTVYGSFNLSGNLTVGGTIQGGYIYSTGHIGAAANITALATVQGAYVLSTGDVHATNYLTGTGVSVGGGGVYTSGSGQFDGNLNANNQVSGNVLYSRGPAYFMNDGSFWIGNGGEGRILNWASNQYFAWNSSDMSQNTHVNGTIYWQVRGDAIAGNPNGAVAALGYITISDPSLKDILDEPVEGLAEVLQMVPIKYQLTIEDARGGGDRPTHIGFNAEHLMTLVPNAVIEIDRLGTPTKYLDSGAVVAVCVNAIQQLEARVASLEAEL